MRGRRGTGRRGRLQLHAGWLRPFLCPQSVGKSAPPPPPFSVAGGRSELGSTWNSPTCPEHTHLEAAHSPELRACACLGWVWAVAPGRMWPWASGPTGSSSPHFLRTPTSCPHRRPIPHSQIPRTSVCVWGGCWQPRPLLLPWGRGADTPQNPGLGWRGEGLLLPSLLLSQGLLGVPHLCAFTPGPLSVSLPPLGFQSRKCQGPQGVSQGRAGRGRASPHLPPPG